MGGNRKTQVMMIKAFMTIITRYNAENLQALYIITFNLNDYQFSFLTFQHETMKN